MSLCYKIRTGDGMPKTNWREFLEGEIKITEDATRRSKYREIRNRARRMMEDLILIAEAAVEPEHRRYLRSLFNYEGKVKIVNPLMAQIRLALHEHSRERELIGIHWGRFEEALAMVKIPYDSKKLYDKMEVDYRLSLVEKLKKYEEKTGKKFSYGYGFIREEESISLQ